MLVSLSYNVNSLAHGVTEPPLRPRRPTSQRCSPLDPPPPPPSLPLPLPSRPPPPQPPQPPQPPHPPHPPQPSTTVLPRAARQVLVSPASPASRSPPHPLSRSLERSGKPSILPRLPPPKSIKIQELDVIPRSLPWAPAFQQLLPASSAASSSSYSTAFAPTFDLHEVLAHASYRVMNGYPGGVSEAQEWQPMPVRLDPTLIVAVAVVADCLADSCRTR